MTVVFCFPHFQVSIRVDGQEVLRDSLPNLRTLWEDTSFQLEYLQANEICVKQEEEGLAKRTQPYFKLTFDASASPTSSQLSKTKQDWYLLCYFHYQVILHVFFDDYPNHLVYKTLEIII